MGVRSQVESWPRRWLDGEPDLRITEAAWDRASSQALAQPVNGTSLVARALKLHPLLPPDLAKLISRYGLVRSATICWKKPGFSGIRTLTAIGDPPDQ